MAEDAAPILPWLLHTPVARAHGLRRPQQKHANDTRAFLSARLSVPNQRPNCKVPVIFSVRLRSIQLISVPKLQAAISNILLSIQSLPVVRYAIGSPRLSVSMALLVRATPHRQIAISGLFLPHKG